MTGDRLRTITVGAFLLVSHVLLGNPASSRAQTVGTTPDTLYVSRTQVINQALARNEKLAAAEAMSDVAAATATMAWRAFLPQIRINEFFLRSNDALMAFGYKLQSRTVSSADFNPSRLNNPGETNQFITRLEANVPIFNGGSGLRGKQAANAISRAARLHHRRAIETVRLQAVQAYEGLALAENFIEVMRDAVASAEGHVRQARALADNGVATEADYLQASVFRSSMQQRLIDATNLAAVAGENIKLLTATDSYQTVATVVDTATGETTPAYDLSAAANRSDILARRAEVEAAGRLVGVAQGALLPHLNLSIQRDLYSPNNPLGNDSQSWSLGIYATWDIFGGMQNIGGVRKARAEHRAARYMADFATREARVQATAAVLNHQAAGQRLAVAREAVLAARESLRIVTQQYREGLISMVNLLDTQAANTAAQGQLAQATHDYRIALAKLEFTGAVPTLHDSPLEDSGS